MSVKPQMSLCRDRWWSGEEKLRLPIRKDTELRLYGKQHTQDYIQDFRNLSGLTLLA